MRAPFLLLLLLLGSLSSGSALAATFLIRPDGTGDLPTIQDGIDAADSGDVISLADGTFRGPGNRGIDFHGKGITVESASGNASDCVIDSELESRGFYFHSGESANATVRNITITGGYDWTAGGVFAWNASPTITGCVIEANQSNGTWGAGIAFFGPGGRLEGTTVRGNWGAGEPVAVQAYNANVTIEDCLIVAAHGGSGLNVRNATTTVRNSTVAMNDVHGIVAASNGHVVVQNSIVAFNAWRAVNCTSNGSVSFSCSDVFGNGLGDWVGCISGQDTISNNLAEDPLFCNLTTLDFHLSAQSPCAPAQSVCGLVGALGVGCGPVSVDAASWGRVKQMYR
ncbi:MAG: right-handed parallel beta-helix repeat-containing protein [bacterium]